MYSRCNFNILLTTTVTFHFHLHSTKSVVCKANNQKSSHLQAVSIAYQNLHSNARHIYISIMNIAQAKCRLMHANNICELRKFEYKMVSNQRQRKRQKRYKPKALAYEQIWDSTTKTASKVSKIFQLVSMSRACGLCDWNAFECFHFDLFQLFSIPNDVVSRFSYRIRLHFSQRHWIPCAG